MSIEVRALIFSGDENGFKAKHAKFLKRALGTKTLEHMVNTSNVVENSNPMERRPNMTASWSKWFQFLDYIIEIEGTEITDEDTEIEPFPFSNYFGINEEVPEEQYNCLYKPHEDSNRVCGKGSPLSTLYWQTNWSSSKTDSFKLKERTWNAIQSKNPDSIPLEVIETFIETMDLPNSMEADKDSRQFVVWPDQYGIWSWWKLRKNFDWRMNVQGKKHKRHKKKNK